MIDANNINDCGAYWLYKQCECKACVKEYWRRYNKEYKKLMGFERNKL